mmetsp:Transcript_9714/g.14044  ORF Transcript_9714/g.14044 Transcript_9714/m.14044 type:complete len:154 (+) Transcript_9714:1049-1510(+)
MNGKTYARMTSQLVTGDKVLIIAGPLQGSKAVFLSHRSNSVEVRLKPGEESKFLNPGIIVPIRDRTPDKPRSKPQVSPNRFKKDDSTLLTEPTYATGVTLVSDENAEVESIQKLVDVQTDKVQRDLELMSSLITSLNVARRSSTSAKPWEGPA